VSVAAGGSSRRGEKNADGRVMKHQIHYIIGGPGDTAELSWINPRRYVGPAVENFCEVEWEGLRQSHQCGQHNVTIVWALPPPFGELYKEGEAWN